MSASLDHPVPSRIIPHDSICTDPVAWQTLYFIFVALAACTATQPCGRVLGMSQKYTMYLRISPLFCIADALLILLFPLFDICGDGKSPKAAFHELLWARFDEEEQERYVTDGNRAKKKAAVFRWIWFTLGGLPPFLKLLAMRGVPGSKAIGIMFTVSFIVTEIALAIHYRSTRQIELPLREDYIRNQRYHQDELPFTSFCTHLSWITFFWCSSVAVLDRQIFGIIENRSRWDVYGNIMYSGMMLIFYMTFTGIFLVCVFFIWTTEEGLDCKTLRAFSIKCAATCMCGIPIVLLVNFMYHQSESELPRPWYVVLLFPFCIGNLLVYAAGEACSMNWAKYVRHEAWDQDAFQDLMLSNMFVTYNILGPVVWFYYMFDPQGTANAQWTSAFG